MNGPRLITRPLLGVSDPMFGETIELYEEAFDLRFRDDTDWFIHRIETGWQDVTIALDTSNGGKMAGLYSIEGDPEGCDASPIIYLPYFATHADYRGTRTVGPALWAALVRQIETLNARAVMIEAEMDRDDPVHSAARIRFYLRQTPWQPKLVTGGYRFYQQIRERKNPPQMHLIVAVPDSVELSPDEAFGLCAEYFEDAVERTAGPIVLQDLAAFEKSLESARRASN